MRKTKFFFGSKCRVQVPNVSDVVLLQCNDVQCIVHLLRENLVKPCEAQDVLPLLNEMSLKDLLMLAKTLRVDSLLPAKSPLVLILMNRDNTSRDSVMDLFKVMIKQPQYGSLSNSQRLFDSIGSLFGTPLLIEESVYKLLLYVHILYNPFNAYPCRHCLIG